MRATAPEQQFLSNFFGWKHEDAVGEVQIPKPSGTGGENVTLLHRCKTTPTRSQHTTRPTRVVGCFLSALRQGSPDHQDSNNCSRAGVAGCLDDRLDGNGCLCRWRVGHGDTEFAVPKLSGSGPVVVATYLLSLLGPGSP